MDGTLIHSCAGHKSYVPKDADADGGDFGGKSRKGYDAAEFIEACKR